LGGCKRRGEWIDRRVFDETIVEMFQKWDG